MTVLSEQDLPDEVVELTAVTPVAPRGRPTWPMSLHAIWLFVPLGVLIAALSLRVVDGSRIGPVGTTWLLPEVCAAKVLIGLPCPGCGLTRSFVSAARGKWRVALGYNAVGFMLFWLLALQIPYRLFQLARLASGRRAWDLRGVSEWLFLSMLLGLVVQWVVAACYGALR